LGVVDEFTRRGWPVFGPTKAAAQLETSKSFAKEFMQRHRIPTAHYAICSSPAEIKSALSRFSAPLVVKADGLAAGKGVVMCQTKDEATAAAGEMLSGRMVGEAGARVVLEECLRGDELSFLVISDGERVAPLVAAQDHKRVGDGDTGPNTGGMGAYSVSGLLDEQMTHWLTHHIAIPVIQGMKAEGMEYKGILYCGLMMTARGPMVLEFNCRFGDPETQAVLALLETPLAGLLYAAATGRLAEHPPLVWRAGSAVTVVVAAAGYPGTPRTGDPISGADAPGVIHAGTRLVEGTLVSSGGRVLCCTATGPTLADARTAAYDLVSRVRLAGSQHRTDIAAAALEGRIRIPR